MQTKLEIYILILARAVAVDPCIGLCKITKIGLSESLIIFQLSIKMFGFGNIVLAAKL